MQKKEKEKEKNLSKLKKQKKMSCLFDSLAALLVERPELLASSAFVELRELREPRDPSGASVRAAICALLARRAIEVHDIALDEWGAMEAGTTRDAYVRGMRDGGTWGGGVEIAAAATALRVPIVVHYGPTRVVFGPNGTGSPDGAGSPIGPYGSNGPYGPYGPYGPAVSVRPLDLRYTGSHYTPVF
jgi:hypothetical protein